MSSTRFCFTYFFKEDNFILWNEDKMNYLIYQIEACPTSGRAHIQGYMETKDKIRESGAKDLLPRGTHVAIARGNATQNKIYCTKEESRIHGPYEFGHPSEGQGSRTDIKELFKLIDDGGTIEECYQKYPLAMVKYGKGVKEYKILVDKRKCKWRDVKVYVLWGEAGAGKTKYVYDNEHSIYKLNQTTQSIWFDGYDGEDVLLIDDFDGWIPYRFLLNLLDGYPLMLPTKGGHTYAKYTKVYITSNTLWTMWYEDMTDKMDPLRRRIGKNTKRFLKERPEVTGNTSL